MKDKRKLKLVLFTAVWLVSVCLFAVVARAQQYTSTPEEKLQAGKAWDALVSAKGGKSKLHSLTNFLMSFDDYSRLNVFPGYSWESYYFPVVDDPGAHVINWEKTTEYYSRSNAAAIAKKMTSRSWIAYEVIPFLLETKWDKPELLRVSQIKKGKRKFDVIETTVEGKRLDFVFEPEEMLVTEVRFYDEKGEWSHSHAMADYVDINGIKMPRHWAKLFEDDVKNEKIDYITVSFAFNVDYDPELFTRPLIATTPDAWKRKPK